MKNWKKLLKLAGVGFMMTAACAGLAGCGGGNKSAAPAGGDKVAKVGFINGVTGGVASYGIAEKEGLDLAVEEINKEGKVKMDVEMVDTKGNVQQAVAAAQKMIAAKKVLVVGPLISGEYKAIGPSSSRQRFRFWALRPRQKDSSKSVTTCSETACPNPKIFLRP